MADFGASIYMPQIQAGAQSGGLGGGILRGVGQGAQMQARREQLDMMRQERQARGEQLDMMRQKMQMEVEKDLFRQQQEKRLQEAQKLAENRFNAQQMQNLENNTFQLADHLRKSGRVQESVKLLEQFYGQQYKSDPSIMTPYLSDIQKMRDPEYLRTITPGQAFLESRDLVARIGEKAGTLAPIEKQNFQLWADNFLAQFPSPNLQQFDPMAVMVYGKNAISLSPQELRFVRRHQIRQDKMRPMPVELIRDIANREESIARVSELIDEFETPEGRVRHRDKFGQIGSRWQAFKTAWVANEEAKELRMKVKGLIDTVYQGAGKQLSDKELDLVKQAWIPEDKEPLPNVIAALRVMKDKMTGKLLALNRNIEKAGLIKDFSKWSGEDFFDTQGGVTTFAPNALPTVGKPPAGAKVLRFNPTTGKLE